MSGTGEHAGGLGQPRDAPRSRSMRSSSRMPNTARRITSSVIACMRGRSGNGSPTGQLSTSRAVASAIISA